MSKTVMLIVLRADRELWTGKSAELRVTDMREGLKVLHRETLKKGNNVVRVNLDLPFDAGQIYAISLDAQDHRAAWQLIKRRSFLREEGGTQIEVQEITMRLMLVPENPKSTDLDQGHAKLLAAGSPTVSGKNGWTKTAYNGLNVAAKMALLNLDAKLRDTRVGGVSLLSFVEGVSHVSPDRLFLYVKPELKQLIDNSPDFATAPGHEKIPKNTTVPLPGHPDSWKHIRFGAGNLQLSFSADTIPLPKETTKRVFSVDADIDLERGLLHVAEWLDNKFIHPSQKTNQTLVYALLFSQGIIPHYTLSPFTVG
jgi:hypothetical protein